MINKLAFVTSIIIFTIVLITSLLLFRVSTGCVDIIGDGYAMGTDSKPVVIGQSCGHWQLAGDYLTHGLLSVLVALTLSITTWGVVWIMNWKSMNIFKKLGIILLMFASAFIGFLAASAIEATLSGGTINMDQTKGIVTALMYLILSLIASIALINLIFKPKFAIKS